MVRHRYAVLDGQELLTIRETEGEAIAYAFGYEKQLFESTGKVLLLDIFPITYHQSQGDRHAKHGR